LNCKASIALTDTQSAPTVRSLSLNTFCTDDTEAVLETCPSRQDAVQTDEIAFLQYTSGSTADPKGVKVTFQNLLINAETTGPAYGIAEHSTIVCWLPFSHDLGLIGNLLQNIYAGAHCVLMSPISAMNAPFTWLEAITKYRGTVTMGPNFAYELCNSRIAVQDCASLDLSSLEVAVNAAEPIRPKTIQTFAEKFKPFGLRPSALRTCYGLAEATLVVSAGSPTGAYFRDGVIQPTNDAQSGRAITGSGFIRGTQNVVVVDPDTRVRVNDGSEGEIWIRGPNVSPGYWSAHEDARDTFSGYLVTGEGPFLRTGDLGGLWDGQLYITGRLKEVIIVNGIKYYPQDIEATAQQCDESLHGARGAAFLVEKDDDDSEFLVLVQEVRRSFLPHVNKGSLIKAIQQAVFAEYAIMIREVALTIPETVPKTSSGKIRRRYCAELYKSGAIKRLEERFPAAQLSGSG
jgi:acyl-CoA synthetase (AMP-forming)/AMP-acid ligase II